MLRVTVRGWLLDDSEDRPEHGDTVKPEQNRFKAGWRRMTTLQVLALIGLLGAVAAIVQAYLVG